MTKSNQIVRSQHFLESLEKRLGSDIERWESLRAQVVGSPTFHSEYELEYVIRTRKPLDLMVLACIYHLMDPKGFRPLIMLELEKHFEKYPEVDYLSASKVNFELWILDNNWSANKILGIFSRQNVARILSLVVFRAKKTSPVRYPERKRGYNDKGTLRPSHLWMETRYSYSEEEYEKELREKRKIKSTYHLGFNGWLGVGLPGEEFYEYFPRKEDPLPKEEKIW